MKFFVDTADTAAIRDLADAGLVDGVTTNPSLIAKSGRDFEQVLREICDMVAGPVSAEVTATSHPEMVEEGLVLAHIAENIAVKVPLTLDGLKACRQLTNAGHMVNVTLCFSANQAILAAKAGAAFVSPFVGRLDDIGQDGMELIATIVDIFGNYEAITTEVLVASVRHPMHIIQAAEIRGDVCTVPPDILKKLVSHPLTDKGLAAFLADWEKTGQRIL